MKRSYKEFKIESFLKDINESNINPEVTAHNDVEGAALEFENLFRYILDTDAPIKVFQMRKNYSTYISDKTKALMKARNAWKNIAVSKGFKTAEKIAKDLGKEIKKAVAEDKKIYFN